MSDKLERIPEEWNIRPWMKWIVQCHSGIWYGFKRKPSIVISGSSIIWRTNPLDYRDHAYPKSISWYEYRSKDFTQELYEVVWIYE